LRHQAITELAEQGAPDATIMALAGRMSRQMMEHYSHVRMVAKRSPVDGIGGGLFGNQAAAQPDSLKPCCSPLRHKPRHKPPVSGNLSTVKH
jgi:hypothetical protein